MAYPIHRTESNASFQSSQRSRRMPKEYQPSIVSSRSSRSSGSSSSTATAQSVGGTPTRIADRFDDWFGGGMSLRPELRRRHIMMISIGGTIGMGLLLSSSKALHLGGSNGLIVSYAMMGTVVIAVMQCISEMVSLIPEPGAISLFPRRFVDDSLGFVVGLSYWFTNAMAVASLTAATADLSRYYSKDALDVDLGWRITVLLIVLIGINIMGIRVYSEVEHFLGWVKILMLIGLTVTMLVINSGANTPNGYIGTRYWREQYKLPPGYDVNPVTKDMKIPGSGGQFLGIWSSTTTATFAYVGVEIAAVTAGEAKYPRRDVAFAMKYVFAIIICLYVSSVIGASLCVPWDNPALWRDGTTAGKGPGPSSPFLIAILEAGYSGSLQGLLNAGFLFAAWTAANNSLYAASRTMFGMCHGMKREQNKFLWPLGRTRLRNGAPVLAIIVSCIFTPLAFLMCGKKNGGAEITGEELLDVLSRMGALGALMTWGSHCLAFLRFYFGMKDSVWNRNLDSYPAFRSHFQPTTAIFGLVSCVLLVVFNGWSSFYGKPFVARDFLAAYLWPLIFFVIYGLHKWVYRTEIKPLSNLDYGYMGPEEQPPPNHGRLRNLFEFERPTPKKPAVMADGRV